MMNKEYLSDFVDETIKSLECVKKFGAKEICLKINCSDLEDFNYVDIRKSDKFKSIFHELKKAEGPSLYWFEIDSNSDSQKVIEAILKYKSNEDAKATPALKSKIDYNSRVLYVGKVKGSFWGRLIQHLGFYKVKATQGLQLYYWAKPLSLVLKIYVLEFDNNMADIMPIIEYAFAKKLKPLIGKHK